MSSSTPSVKRQNHRVHPCLPERKPELLNTLLRQNEKLNILVVAVDNPEAVACAATQDNVTVTSDIALAETPQLQCDLLISYDLPESAEAYMARLSHAKTHALILLDPKEQKSLYPIERLLGRTLVQEIIDGFDPEPVISPKEETKAFKPRDGGRERKRDEKSGRNDRRSPRKPGTSGSKEKNSSDRWAKKEREPSRYLGKDENGKPLFSGKTGERNHKYDGTPKDGSDKNAKKRSEGKSKFSQNDKKRSDEKPRAYDAKKRDATKEKKPFNDAKGDKRDRKPYEGSSKKRAAQDDAKNATPKRAPRKFGLKTLKPGKEGK